jgi:DNA-binding response OmpR family regulator
MPKKRAEPEFDLIINGTSVRLPQREHDLLHVLQQRKGAPITAAALEREVAGVYRGSVPGSGARGVVHQLRTRLEYAGLPAHRLIRNAYGLGYYWVEPERAAETPNLRGKKRHVVPERSAC